MKRRRLNILLAVVLLISAYAVWCRTGRDGTYPTMLLIRHVSEYGTDAHRGNVLSVQPFMLPADYYGRSSFANKLSGYLDEACRKGFLNEKTVVVFPEYIGTWLVTVGEKHGRYYPTTLTGAVGLMIASNPISFVRALSSAKGSDKIRDALFRMKAERMADVYETTFAALAEDYGVTVVAGSIVLPSPKITDGRLKIGAGPLYNTSVVWGPDGEAVGLVTKVFPTKDEQPFTSAGKVDDIPVFDTAAGKLAVLVCADAWFPESYQVAKHKGASIVVVPAYGMGDDKVWQRTWSGYSGFDNPSDVDRGDPSHITERQAFMKYSLPGRLPKSGIPYGASVCLRGTMWDIGSHGSCVVVRKGRVHVAPEVDGAALVNLWL